MRRCAGTFCAVFVLLSAAVSLAQPKPELWPRWSVHDQTSETAPDHSAWDRWLGEHVVVGRDGVNRIDYGKVSASGRAALAAYMAMLTGTRVSGLNRPQQMAFWINLYNALTVKLVLDNYPVASILRILISPGLFSLGPWKKKLLRIEGEMLSLDDIEHRILRPIWRDARIHYAVNCASIGCPNLARRAFRGAHMEAMLDAAAQAHVNNWRGAEIIDGGLHVSKLYKWYVEDFGGSEASVLAHLRRYAGPELKRRLEGVTEIEGYRYDWDLNDAAGNPPP